MKQENKDVVADCIEWFRAAGLSHGSRIGANVQLSCLIEEVSELLKSCGLNNIAVHALSQRVRREWCAKLNDRKNILDALADIVVTCIGMSEIMGMDFMGALAEVNRSNWSKFQDGNVLRDKHGKIMKGKDYSPPNLAQFIKFQGK